MRDLKYLKRELWNVNFEIRQEEAKISNPKIFCDLWNSGAGPYGKLNDLQHQKWVIEQKIAEITS